MLKGNLDIVVDVINFLKRSRIVVLSILGKSLVEHVQAYFLLFVHRVLNLNLISILDVIFGILLDKKQMFELNIELLLVLFLILLVRLF